MGKRFTVRQEIDRLICVPKCEFNPSVAPNRMTTTETAAANLLIRKNLHFSHKLSLNPAEENRSLCTFFHHFWLEIIQLDLSSVASLPHVINKVVNQHKFALTLRARRQLSCVYRHNPEKKKTNQRTTLASSKKPMVFVIQINLNYVVPSEPFSMETCSPFGFSQAYRSGQQDAEGVYYRFRISQLVAISGF